MIDILLISGAALASVIAFVTLVLFVEWLNDFIWRLRK